MGRPEQLNIATLLKPPLGVTETVNVADCPALIESVLGLTETAMSAVFPGGGATDCKACTKSRRPLPMPGSDNGTAWAMAVAALDWLVVLSKFKSRAPAPETKGALKDVPHPAA